jgi:acetyl-CoA carboxylase biotin carboxylase subunit
MVTGIDLVAEQLRVAGGLPLSFGQEDIRCEGAALEFRINAEDPTKNFLPSPGKITHMLLPGGPGVRVDTGVTAGCSVQPFYDSMLAKLLIHGRDRAQALARARRALDELEIEGVSTTQPLHRSLLDWPGLAEATAHTQSLEAFLAASSAAPCRRG